MAGEVVAITWVGIIAVAIASLYSIAQVMK